MNKSERDKLRELIRTAARGKSGFEFWYKEPDYENDYNDKEIKYSSQDVLRFFDYVDRLEDRKDELSDALLKYGSHLKDCPAPLNEEYEVPCTCGFSQALEGTK